MSVQRKQIHDYLWERRVPAEGGMPTAEELDTASATLDYVEEFFLEPARQRVFRLLNEEWEKFDASKRPETPPVTYADVGALLSFATNVRCTLDEITRGLDAIEETRRGLAITVEAGRVENEPEFTDYGRPKDPDESARRALESLGAR